MLRTRRCFVASAASALVALASSTIAYAQPNAPDRPLRVMTYNIKHGQTNMTCTQPPPIPGQPPFPDCALDLQASIDVIRTYAPDVIGLQEIDRFWARSSSLDEPAEIAGALGYDHYCYAANLNHNPDNHATVPHQYGTVIVSRYPIIECGNLLLRRTGTGEQRGLTRALINVKGVPLQFFNTHLHTLQADRVLQTEDIAAALDAAPDTPKILMGDFNARPTAAEMAVIFPRVVDTWATAGIPDTVNPDGNTSPADVDRDPTARIDYIFASPDIGLHGTFVPLNDATRFAADHYPIVADVTLPGSAAGVEDGETGGRWPNQ